MNPLFDLIVIGVIVSMVWLNLYFSKDPSQPTVSFWSLISQKRKAINPLGHKTTLEPSGSSRA